MEYNMKYKNTYGFIALMVMVVIMGACNNDDAYDELPDSVAKFVSEYYPFTDVSSYDMKGGNYVVNMKNGATLVFDSSLAWVEVNGNGDLVPETFLYNCLPEALYDYLSEMTLTQGIYKVVRNADNITVYTVDTYIRYDIASGQINYPTARGIAALYFSE